MDRIDAARALVMIVDGETFTGAARALGVRQATVSRWIVGLEEEVGAQLLNRTTRAASATAAGIAFAERARAMISEWEDALTIARREQDQIVGRVRLNVPVVFGQRFLLGALPALITAHPELELELELSDRYVNLIEERVDVAVRVGRPVDSELRSRTLGVSPRRLVASPSYLRARGRLDEPGALVHHACLLHTELDNRVTWTFQRDGEEHRVDVRGRVRANHSEALLHMARAGAGVALLASWLVDDAIARGELVSLLPEFSPPAAPVQVLMPSSRYRSLAVSHLVDFIQETLDGSGCFEGHAPD